MAPVVADNPSETGAAAPVTERAARPADLDATYWDDDAGALKTDDVVAALNEAKAAKTAADERKATVPESADGYTLKLPEGVEIPEGFTLDENNPLFVAGREAAHKMGLPQADFSQLAGIVLQNQIAEQKAFVDRMGEERAKLGPEAGARVAAVTDALVARLGENAKPHIKLMVSAQMVESYERLLNSSGEFAFGQQGRTTGRADGRPENWDQLSALDRRSYDLSNPRA